LLYHSRWRKKKVESYIIPPSYFKSNYSIVEVSKKLGAGSEKLEDLKMEVGSQNSEELKLEVGNNQNKDLKTEVKIEENLIINEASKPIIESPKPTAQNLQPTTNISALSLASIKAKRELEQQNKSLVKETVHLPTETFTQTEMQLFWNKYAQRLGDKGFKIIESLLLLNDPTLEGTTIVHELPNEGSKIEFESEKVALLGYLRGHLHNHDITIEVRVNEAVENKFAFTPQDKYNRLNEINPSLELLRKTFDLDF
jgi:DNA polymerase III subunit gamma/tau